MEKINEFRMTLWAKSVNEGFCRAAVAAFAAQADPMAEEISDIKTAVSEAVTNCIVHAYPHTDGRIYLSCQLYRDGRLRISIRDTGCGIEDIKKAREPLFSTMGGDRSGLGFSVMESFSDKMLVRSRPGKGTTVILEKRIRGRT